MKMFRDKCFANPTDFYYFMNVMKPQLLAMIPVSLFTSENVERGLLCPRITHKGNSLAVRRPGRHIDCPLSAVEIGNHFWGAS